MAEKLICAGCIHERVCIHKDMYTKAVEAVQDASIYWHSVDDEHKTAFHTKHVTDIPCVGEIYVDCKFFFEKSRC